MKNFLPLAIAILIYHCSTGCGQPENTNTAVKLTGDTDPIPGMAPVSDWYAEAGYQLSIIKNMSGNYYRDAADVLVETGKFDEAAEVAAHFNDALPDSTKAMIIQLKTALTGKQVIMFPLMRKAFVKFMDKLLEEEDIAMAINGTAIEVTGSIYAVKSNAASGYEIIRPQLQLLRFKQINYRPYKGAAVYTGYKIPSKEDADISFAAASVQ